MVVYVLIAALTCERHKCNHIARFPRERCDFFGVRRVYAIPELATVVHFKTLAGSVVGGEFTGACKHRFVVSRTCRTMSVALVEK